METAEEQQKRLDKFIENYKNGVYDPDVIDRRLVTIWANLVSIKSYLEGKQLYGSDDAIWRVRSMIFQLKSFLNVPDDAPNPEYVTTNTSNDDDATSVADKLVDIIDKSDYDLNLAMTEINKRVVKLLKTTQNRINHMRECIIKHDQKGLSHKADCEGCQRDNRRQEILGDLRSLSKEKMTE